MGHCTRTPTMRTFESIIRGSLPSSEGRSSPVCLSVLCGDCFYRVTESGKELSLAQDHRPNRGSSFCSRVWRGALRLQHERLHAQRNLPADRVARRGQV